MAQGIKCLSHVNRNYGCIYIFYFTVGYTLNYIDQDFLKVSGTSEAFLGSRCYFIHYSVKSIIECSRENFVKIREQRNWAPIFEFSCIAFFRN